MCGPAAVIIPIAMAAASTAASAIGAIREGKAAEAEAQARADTVEQQAQARRNQGQFQVAQERRQQRRALSQQVTQASGQGTTLEGQPLDLLADSAKQAELALQAIRFENEIGIRDLENQADFIRFQGRQARSSAFFRAGTALLTGSSDIAEKLDFSNATTGDNDIRNVTPPIPRGNPRRGVQPGRGPSIRR